MADVTDVLIVLRASGRGRFRQLRMKEATVTGSAGSKRIEAAKATYWRE